MSANRGSSATAAGTERPGTPDRSLPAVNRLLGGVVRAGPRWPPRWTEEEREATRGLLLVVAVALVLLSLVFTDPAAVELGPTLVVLGALLVTAFLSRRLERSAVWSRTSGILLVALLAVLVAETGGHESHFEDLYLLVLVFTAAFRSTLRFAEIAVLTLLAIGAPFSYAGFDADDLADLLVDAPMWFLAAGIVHLLVQQFHRSARERDLATQELRSLFAHHPDAVLRLTLDGSVEERNEAAEHLLGPVERLVGAALPSERDRVDALLAIAGTGTPGTAETVLRRTTGEPCDVQLVIVPILAEGGIVGVYAVARDISTRRDAERMRDQFIAVASHELRTPLTAVHGAIGLLASGLVDPSSDRGRQTLSIAASNTERLVRLVSDLLDLERLESGSATLQLEDHPAQDLVDQALATVAPQAEARRLDVRSDVDTPTVRCDGDRIVQTLTNLVGNAVKFSAPGGSIEVSVAAAHGEAVFRVVDHGRGVPDDHVDTIFDRFAQVEPADADRGSGLGLPICRTIVRQHGGRVWVERTSGGGSTFCFTLPDAPGTER